MIKVSQNKTPMWNTIQFIHQNEKAEWRAQYTTRCRRHILTASKFSKDPVFLGDGMENEPNWTNMQHRHHSAITIVTCFCAIACICWNICLSSSLPESYYPLHFFIHEHSEATCKVRWCHLSTLNLTLRTHSLILKHFE